MLLRTLAIVALTAGLASAEPSNEEKILGVWVATTNVKGKDYLVTIEFRKGGVALRTVGYRNTSVPLKKGTWKIENDVLTWDFKGKSGEDAPVSQTIKELTEETLITTSKKSPDKDEMQEMKFKRKKQVGGP